MKAEAIYSLLVIDDQPTFFDQFFKRSPQFKSKYETELERGIATLLSSSDFDAVLLDLAFSDQDSVHEGLEKLPEWIGACTCPVIIVSNHDHIRTYQAALHLGAAGYLFKKRYTADVTHWQQYIENTIKWYASAQKSRIEARGIDSDNYLAVERKFRALHTSDRPILLSGESGVGKGRIIERLWRDALAPKHKITEISLLQEVDKSLSGVIKLHSSTDIIYWRGLEQLNPNRQIELLKLLNGKAFQGASRWFFSTTQSLEQLEEAHHLLPHLAQYFEDFEVWIPPLRDRAKEVSDWLQLFLSDPATCPIGTRFFHREVEEVFTGQLIEALQRYPWPGNIRELRAVTQISIAEAEKENEDIVSVDALPDRIKRYSIKDRTVKKWSPEQQKNYELLGRIQRALNEASQKWEEAALQLGFPGAEELRQELRRIYCASPNIFTPELCQRYGFEYGFDSAKRVFVVLDENSRDVWRKLEVQLHPYSKRYPILVNDSNNFIAGDRRGEIRKSNLNQADIVLLIICPDLFHHHDRFVDLVLDKCDQVRIVPIYARPYNWQAYDPRLDDLSPLPATGKAISTFPERQEDEVLLAVAKDIKKVFDNLR